MAEAAEGAAGSSRRPLAADSAAGALHGRQPPPLPLPPGMCIQQLPSMLRPVKSSYRPRDMPSAGKPPESEEGGEALEPEPRLSVSQRASLWQSRAAPSGQAQERAPVAAQWQAGSPDVPAVASFAAAEGALVGPASAGTTAEVPVAGAGDLARRMAHEAAVARGPAIGVGDLGCRATDEAESGEEQDGPAVERCASMSRRALVLAQSAVLAAAAGHDEPDASEEETYLWLSRSDKEIARDIESTLSDFDTLAQECDSLFVSCCTRVCSDSAADSGGSAGSQPEDGDHSEQRLPSAELQIVTQTLIDKLGCRGDPVLERIGMIYGAAASDRGVGLIEFRGYVAAVLTQIQRELEERDFDGEQRAQEHAPAEQQASMAQALLGSARATTIAQFLEEKISSWTKGAESA